MCRSILPLVLPLLPLYLYWDPHFEHAKSPRARANQRGKLLDASPLPSVSQAFNASMLCKLCHNQCRAQKEQPIAKKGQEEKKKRKKERRKSKKEKKRKKEKEKLGNTKRLTQPNKPDMLASIATRIEDDGELCIEIHMEMMICTSQNEGPQNKGLRRANMDRNPAERMKWYSRPKREFDIHESHHVLEHEDFINELLRKLKAGENGITAPFRLVESKVEQYPIHNEQTY
ncbi:hypothetical protein Tco_1458421 [Tanacetum coccineum]